MVDLGLKISIPETFLSNSFVHSFKEPFSDSFFLLRGNQKQSALSFKVSLLLWN
jgi:hypothetical protein